MATELTDEGIQKLREVSMLADDLLDAMGVKRGQTVKLMWCQVGGRMEETCVVVKQAVGPFLVATNGAAFNLATTDYLEKR